MGGGGGVGRVGQPASGKYKRSAHGKTSRVKGSVVTRGLSGRVEPPEAPK
jgi:hypothetical protein